MSETGKESKQMEQVASLRRVEGGGGMRPTRLHTVSESANHSSWSLAESLMVWVGVGGEGGE